MKKLKDISRAERVDSWSTALLIMMAVHVGLNVLSDMSLLVGVLAAAGYLVGRRWLRQLRMQGQGAIAWTAVRVFETACVSLVVFVLATMYAGFTQNPAIFYVLGGVLSGGFVTYRALTWHRQYEDGKDEPHPPER